VILYVVDDEKCVRQLVSGILTGDQDASHLFLANR